MSKPLRVLIIEDSEDDAALLVRRLRRATFDVTSERVETPDAMAASLNSQPWDIVIGDYTLPRFSGLAALELLKKSGLDIPFIFVSGTIGEDTAVAAMKDGASDYILKGNLRRLVPAIERELREAEVRRERRRAGQDITLLQSITKAVSEGEDLSAALSATLRLACEATGWICGEVWIPPPDGKYLESVPVWYSRVQGLDEFRRVSEGFKFAPGVGFPGRAWESRQPLWVRDIAQEKNCPRAAIIEEAGLKTAMVFPICANEEVVAVMNFFAFESREDDERLLGLVSTVAAQLGLVFRRKLAEERERKNMERIRALHEVNLAITSTLDLRAVLDVLLEKIHLDLPYAAAVVRLFNKENGVLELVASHNINEEEWKERTPQRPPRAWEVFQNKKPLVVPNLQTDPQGHNAEFFREQGLVSFLGIPLRAKDESLGILAFYTKGEHQFSDEEIGFLTTIAGQAAIAINNSQLYEQTKNQAEALETSNKVKDEFLSVMSHELRTPLNVVMGYAGMMKDGMLGEINPKQDNALQKVLARANEQLAMINNILYATVMESTRVPVDRQVIVLAELFSELESFYYGYASGKDLTFNWSHPADFPVIETDRAKLRHVLQNLVDNAIKFTEKGQITVSALHNPERRTLEISVTDTGIGISDDMIPTIFDKFRQVDSSDTRLYGGVGMGLYIAKKFCELLAGSVEVKSEVGKGSTFTVRIPLRRR
jgi:signal transduction histidine kinase/FixJ family two-component response regulator